MTPNPEIVAAHGLHPRRIVLDHVIPRVLEATLVPSGIFYVFWRFFGIWAALLAALAYAGALIVRRIVQGRPVPALVVIAMIGLTIRTLVSVGSGSTFIYFLQPVLATALISVLFLVSVLVGRPLVNRLAADFCPLSVEDASRVAVRRHYRNLTLFWSGVLLAHAVLSLVLLLTMSVGAFVTAKTVFSPVLTCVAVVLTVVWSVRVARSEGLATPSRRTLALSVGV